MYVYLDHNIIDDISKGDLSLKPSEKVIWVYSNENFVEIQRSGDDRFLYVLEKLKAIKMELILDDNFRMTGGVNFLEYQSPCELYELYLDATSEFEIKQESDFELMARLFGGDNKNEVQCHPNSFVENMKALLEPSGMYTNEVKLEVERVRDDLSKFVNGPLQDVEELEKNRQELGTHKGRAGNLADKENPIEEIWKIIQKGIPEMTADQYFGFDPIDRQSYEEWPIFLGIVGCHTALNFFGFRSDNGLSKAKEIPGILSDASHIAYAAYCHGLMSRDRKLIAKAKAIYRYKNIGTKLITFERNDDCL